jgi:hypothetical protein
MTGWPEHGSKQHASLMRDCLNCAMLLGATFEHTDRGWCVVNYRLALLPLGYHETQADAARAWLARHGYSMAYDHLEDTWSPVSI